MFFNPVNQKSHLIGLAACFQSSYFCSRALLRPRAPTLAVWGSVGGIAVIHFTDWRLILDYVPYINGKFKKD